MILVRMLLMADGMIYAREEMLPEEVVARAEAALKQFRATHNRFASDTNGVKVDLGRGAEEHLVAMEFPAGRKT